uniref:Ig-like domain-containing protein n=1 Tax=Leptobrachium leishanense TaxID=445787 RepID=A0A8C5M4U6_9ANUR
MIDQVAEQSSKVKVVETQVFGKPDDKVSVNCTSEYDKVWKTSLRRNGTENGPGWHALAVIVELREAQAECFALESSDVIHQDNVTVYGYVPPNQVTMDMPEVLQDGKLYDINCSVYNVAPLKFLKMVLTRDEDVIGTKKFEEHRPYDLVNETVTFQLEPQRNDHQKDFSCKAILELGTYRNITKSSPNVTVSVFHLPPIEITSEKWIEIGSEREFKCVLPNAFPAENISMEMTINENLLNTSTQRADDGTVTGVARYNASKNLIGDNLLGCFVEVFGISNNTNLPIIIYEHPKISLNLSQSVVESGNNVTAQCDIKNDNKALYGISILHNREICQENSTGSVTCEINVTQRRPSVTIRCKGYLFQNPSFVEEASHNLSVYYPPQFTDHSCNKNFIWVENKTENVPCIAEGNPTPIVTCQIPSRMTRHDSNIYSCEASNSVGRDEKSVNITVQYFYPPSLRKTPEENVQEGNVVKLECVADCHPGCNYTWEIPDSANVEYADSKRVININEAKTSHSGTYSCRASNVHGNGTRSIELIVEGKNTWPLILGIISAIVLVALIIGAIIYFLYRNGKIGSYHVQRRTHEKVPNHENIPMGNGA